MASSIILILMNKETRPREFLETREDQLNWKPCMFCGSEIVQERKASFVCINCKQTYIADEQDMER